MKHIVVDLEMNGISKEHKEERQFWGREVIEIGAVVLDDSYNEIGSFKTLVKPQYNDRITPKAQLQQSYIVFVLEIDTLNFWESSFTNNSYASGGKYVKNSRATPMEQVIVPIT